MLDETERLREQIKDLQHKVEYLTITVESFQLSTNTQKIDAALRRADLSKVRLPDIAASLNLSQHALGHRLTKEGSSFQSMLDAERKRRVNDHLKINPNATCLQLTNIAGYSDHQNLVRAFKRWFGMTLSEYKVLTGN